MGRSSTTSRPSFHPAVKTEPSEEDIRDALTELFGDLGEEELLATLEEVESYERDLLSRGPSNPDELWQWIADEIGVEMTREKVCEDHEAPFDVLCDMYFEERFEWPHPQLGTRMYGGLGSILVMANRGGSKTFIVALLHFLNSSFKPGCEGVTFGAVEEQSKRCYAHLTPWVTVVKVDPRTGRKKPVERDGIQYSQRSETLWEPVEDAHGVPRASKVEILSGTKEAVNGPHPNLAHADEAEQMKDETWDESRNMAIAGKDAWGRPIRPRNVATSTRKSKHGRMQQLINEITKAKAKGYIPVFELCVWCIWETAAQVPNCRSAPENQGRPNDELCQCNIIPKGMWDDGRERMMDEVCGGKLFLSRGWQPLNQVQELFRQNPRPVWEAQQECREPETEHNYIQGWRPARSVIWDYDPDPQLGPIFFSTDWGAGNPNAANWYQYLYYDIEVDGYDRSPKVLPAGSVVVFDEIYEADIGAGKLGLKVVERERRWRSIYPDWRVHTRFADPAGRQSKLDFRDTSGMEFAWWGATRDVQTGIDLVVDLHEGTHFDKETHDQRGYLFATASNEVQTGIANEEQACTMWRLEVEFWRKNPKTGLELQELNHCMANCRYFLVNLEKGMGRHVAGHKHRGGASSPQTARAKSALRPSKRGPLRFGGPAQSAVEREFGRTAAV